MDELEKKRQIELAYKERDLAFWAEWEMHVEKESERVSFEDYYDPIVDISESEMEERFELKRGITQYEDFLELPHKNLEGMSIDDLRFLHETYESIYDNSFDADCNNSEVKNTKKLNNPPFLYDYSGDDSSLNPLFW